MAAKPATILIVDDDAVKALEDMYYWLRARKT